MHRVILLVVPSTRGSYCISLLVTNPNDRGAILQPCLTKTQTTTTNMNPTHLDHGGTMSSSSSSSSISCTSQEPERKCLSFPLKLRAILDDAVELGLEHVVSWQLSGTAFQVHNTGTFINQIMPKYFNQTKYKSFQRQLNLYGFSRITRGPRKGCYHHELFTRNNKAVCKKITRKKASEEVQFTGDVVDLAPAWLPASMVVEPTPIPEQTKPATSGMMDAFESYFENNVVGQGQQASPKPEDDCLKKKPASKISVTPSTVDVDPGDALQRMLDTMLEQPSSETLSPEDTEDEDKKKSQRTSVFPEKLYVMLEHCQVNGLQRIASWEMNGLAFKVHDIDLFMTHVMPHFFKQTKYESLQRQLNLYGFTRVPKGPMKGCYHHPLFLKGGRSLSRGMARRKPEEFVLLPSSSSSGYSDQQTAPQRRQGNSLPSPNLVVLDEFPRSRYAAPAPAPQVEETTSSSLIEPDPLPSHGPPIVLGSMNSEDSLPNLTTATMGNHNENHHGLQDNTMWAFGFTPTPFH
jgi:hypothetical protein